MIYELMHGDHIFGTATLSADGRMEKYHISDMDHAPLQHKYEQDGLKEWWDNRSVPMTQEGIRKLLLQNGYKTTQEYLLKNLGLSLTDTYWIRPTGSDLEWEKVNLFTNDFTSDISHLDIHKDETMQSDYTPNSSVQGQLEKCWFIHQIRWR